MSANADQPRFSPQDFQQMMEDTLTRMLEKRESITTDMPATHGNADDALVAAIDGNNLRGFRKALQDGADVNAGGGKPLQQAARADNVLFMKELVLHGADIAHAVNELTKQVAALPRKRVSNGDYIPRTTYRTKADAETAKQLSAVMRSLKEFGKAFNESAAQTETVRLQFEILTELRLLRTEITQAIHGKPLPKPRLKAPGAGEAQP